jgi:hypothetical protein
MGTYRVFPIDFEMQFYFLQYIRTALGTFSIISPNQIQLRLKDERILYTDVNLLN